MNKQNRQTVIASFTAVQAGIDKYMPSGGTLGGVAYTNATLKNVFASAITALNNATALHKQWQDAVQAAHTAESNGHAVYDLLRSQAIAQFGKDANTALAAFGMETPKPKGPKTVEAKAEGVQKRAATRAVRHTMGSVQKKAVKGTVEVPAISIAGTPVAASGAPSTAPTVTPPNGGAPAKAGS